jgi:Flp pilus assembly protein CpaB
MATSATPRHWTRLAAPGRIDGRMLLGVALVAVSIAGGLLLWGSASETVPVLVADRDLPQGHVITRDDLAIEELHTEGALSSLVIPDGELGTLVGQTLGTRVHAGEPLIRADLTSGPVIRPSEVAVTIPVEADAVYPGLRPGDAVTVLGTPGGTQADGLTVTVLERALIYDVSLERGPATIGRDGEETRGLSNVTLVVPKDDAEQLAHAAVSWTVTLALLASDGAEETASE